MTAINLDLDKQFKFDFKRKVIVAGKEYNVIFNDATSEILTDLRVEMQGLGEKVGQAADNFEHSMTVAERKDYLHKTNVEARKKIMESLDEIFGAGEGQRIYDYFGQQMYVLMKIVRALLDTQRELVGEKKINDQRKHAARKRSYTKKKVRHAVANREA